jgi:type I restriction enzyme, S subunit
VTSEWREVTVDQIKAPAENALTTGPFGSSISSRYFQDSGVPVIRGSNLSESVDRRLIEDDLVFLSPQKASEFRRSVARRGDLIFTCWGTVGQVGIIDERSRFTEYVISNKQMKLTPDPNEADSLFLYYCFSGPEMSALIKQQAIGSSVPGFNLGQLKALRLRLPPLHEQRAVARILGALDDKIELNSRLNATLEEVAQALFKSWFVEFDPVVAKAAAQRPRGLDPATATLFPARFVDSEDGPIPAEWGRSTLGDVIEINGKSMTQEYPHHAIEYVDISSVSVGRLGVTTSHELGKAPSRARRLVSDGDTIWSCVRPNRKSYLYIDEPPANEVVSTGFAVLSPRGVPPSFLYELVTTDSFVDYLAANAEGSAYPAVRPEVFARADFILPSKPVLDAFERIVRPLRKRVAQNARESLSLASLRDTILPKLVSGQIRVARAEKQLQQVI